MTAGFRRIPPKPLYEKYECSYGNGPPVFRKESGGPRTGNMTEVAKKEKARRVWRLNKKEGVPVLEALETVDISKDVNYRIKDDWEEEWEEEILTVEQIQKRLAELDEKLEKRENKLQQLEERVQKATQVAGKISSTPDLDHRLWALQEDMDGMEERVELLEERANLTNEEEVKRFHTFISRFTDLEDQNLPSRVSKLESVASEARSRSEKNSKKINSLKHDIPESVWEMI